MGLAIDVVKQGKRAKESFDRDKLHASLYATCLSVRSLDGLADDTAKRVTDLVILWAQDKPEITTRDIRHQAARLMHPIHPDAAHFYKHHKQIM